MDRAETSLPDERLPWRVDLSEFNKTPEKLASALALSSTGSKRTIDMNIGYETPLARHHSVRTCAVLVRFISCRYFGPSAPAKSYLLVHNGTSLCKPDQSHI